MNDRIDRYQLLAELGRGATGVVYKARDPELGRLVAIKTLRPPRERPTDESGQLQRRLRREAATVARLNHTNIVAIYDVVMWRDIPCVVMEYVDGWPLAHLMGKGPLPPAQVVGIVRQICDALEYAHGLGAVHRDIKPGNILVTGGGLAKLGDFSLARVAGPDGEEPAAMVGTPGYMAPEQVADGAMDARSDVFSLGVVLYEAVSGVRAFPGFDLPSVLYDTAHVEPPSPRELNAAVTGGLAAVIRRAMAKRPEERYESARALGQALARLGEPERAAARTVARRSLARAVMLGLLGLAVAGTTRGSLVTAAPPRPPVVGSNEAHRVVETSRERAAGTPPVPRPERTGKHPLISGAAAGSPIPARVEHPAPAPEPRDTPPAAAAPSRQGCLSVNAVPFATVLVDGQSLGETPIACLRVGVGEHRVQLEQAGDRSPERVVRIAEQHTLEHPVRLSYDFRSRQFGD
ncbi:MAG TPA: protein kinase [Methylomirabilota bacterium]|nr:protein kinase [Methylomirabilota bacterium]